MFAVWRSDLGGGMAVVEGLLPVEAGGSGLLIGE